MVEAARTFFMSSLAQPTIAPKRSVIAPMMATAVAAMGAAMKTSPERTIR